MKIEKMLMGEKKLREIIMGIVHCNLRGYRIQSWTASRIVSVTSSQWWASLGKASLSGKQFLYSNLRKVLRKRTKASAAITRMARMSSSNLARDQRKFRWKAIKAWATISMEYIKIKLISWILLTKKVVYASQISWSTMTAILMEFLPPNSPHSEKWPSKSKDRQPIQSIKPRITCPIAMPSVSYCSLANLLWLRVRVVLFWVWVSLWEWAILELCRVQMTRLRPLKSRARNSTGKWRNKRVW